LTLQELVRQRAAAFGANHNTDTPTAQATTSDFMGRLNPFGCG